MGVVSSAARQPPAFAKNFPAEAQYWERSADAGVTYAYNPAASVSHPGAAVAGTERYRLKFTIPAGLGGTFTFTISGDKFDGGGTGGTLWMDAVQINPNTGASLTENNTVINVVPGAHVLEWRHGTWTGAGLTVPIIVFSYVNTFYTGQP